MRLEFINVKNFFKMEIRKTIFKDVKSTDSMIFNLNDLWWLITTFSNSGHGNESELQIFIQGWSID